MPDETPTLDLGDAGINFDRHAKWREERSVRTRGRWLQVRVRNTTGRFVVQALQVEAVTAGRGQAADRQ